MRRVGVLIDHFRRTPTSALFAAIERSVQPEVESADEDEQQEPLQPHQIMQVYRWTEQDEMTRQLIIAVHQLLSAWTGEPIPLFPHPWDAVADADSESVAARNRARMEAYRSPEAAAARALVVAPAIPQPTT